MQQDRPNLRVHLLQQQQQSRPNLRVHLLLQQQQSRPNLRIQLQQEDGPKPPCPKLRVHLLQQSRDLTCALTSNRTTLGFNLM
ncbi:hypothetical protein JOB18_036543 [Solea senegalensis]|uniref:Uncharacterized protein n=1 Tax=Solea senegalensis TaxID=28829 RepID=A0AAV6S3H5_SOLSE|nr:hypothetical protein JOB18_036543 [Solea senegalensis]